MKLFDIIGKEIAVVKSQRIALVLIILYPLLAILLLGLALNGTSLQAMGSINVGLVNNLPYDLNVVEELASQNKNVNLFNYSDTSTLISAVTRKEVVVGLVLSSKSENSQIIADLYYDNSNLAASGVFKDFAKIVMQNFAIEQTKEKLSTIWGVLSSLGSNIDGEVKQIDEFKLMLSDAEKSINSLESKLNKVDLGEIGGTLDSTKSNINSYQQKNEEFRKSLDDFRDSFNKIKTQLKTFDEEFSVYRSDITFISNELNSMSDEIDSILAGTVDDATRNALLSQKQSIQNIKTKVNAISNGLNEISNENSSLNSKIAEADAIFLRLDQESQSISSALSGSTTTIDSMNSKLAVFRESVDEVKQLIVDSKKSKLEIESKLNSSSSLMSSFSDDLIGFSKMDTAVLAQPLLIYEKRLFSPQSQPLALMPLDPLLIGGIVANAISIVLILTCLLLTSITVILERNEKVTLRTRLSPTPKSVLLTGKIIGQLVIALVEATIIYLVAIFGFGLNLFPHIVEIYVATLIISVAFISLGLIISSLVKTQSTSILLSLLLIVPMLFLSGIIVPIDLMNSYMQIASNLLPLTAANNLLLGITIKGLSVLNFLNEIYILVIIIIVGAMVYLLKEDA